VYGLELRGVRWEAGGCYRIDQDPLCLARGGRAVVVTTGAVAAALADVLTGLSRPAAGRILADGVDVSGQPPAPDRIALVPAGGGLLPHLSVARNIELNLDRTASARARAAQVRKLAARLQLEGALELAPHRLSPEQRLRVAVARALARQPGAVVAEDRAGETSCAPVVHAAAGENVAVLVVTDAPARARALSARVCAAVRVPDPRGETPGDAPGDAPGEVAGGTEP
jgi:ABC-type thiamine transport system ATPase subunit